MPAPAPEPRPPAALQQDRRAAVALMTAVMAPAFLVALAVMTDAGLWLLGSTNLQIAADAAAMGAGQLLVNGSNATAANLLAAATYEAQHAATKLVGTMNAPTVVPLSGYTQVQVTITSQAPSYLSAVTRLVPGFSAMTPPLLRATATITYKGGPKACVLALAPSGTSAIEVDNSGQLAASYCPIFANSSGTPAIHATGSGKISETGAITGADIGTVGTVGQDNGGSITAATITQNMAKAAADPNSGIVNPPVPNGTPVASTNNYNAGGMTYNLTPQQWNGDVTFSNNVTVNFAPGTYYVTNGSLTFSNIPATFQSTTSNGVTTGVNFVLTGSSPGNFSWTNYSNSNPIIAPSSGTLSGIAVYQGCNSSGSQTSTFNGGSTMIMTGTFYAPCSAFSATNNMKFNAAGNMPFSVIAKTITVQGSAQVNTSGGTGASTNNAGPVLTQ